MDHRGHVLGPIRRAVDRRELSRVTWIADRDSAKALDSFGKEIDQLELLVSVLVEQKVQLVKGGPATSQ